VSANDVDGGLLRPAQSSAAGVASIVLAMCGAACAMAGYFSVWFPVIGALVSFAGPLFASAAIVGGSIAVRRDRSGPTRSWRGTTGRVGRGLGVLVLPPTLLIALTCGVLNAAGTAYLHGRLEEHAAERRADEARGSAFWRRPSSAGPWSSPEMPWHLREGERESGVQSDVRHTLELALELVRIAQQNHDDVADDVGDTEAARDAGVAR